MLHVHSVYVIVLVPIVSMAGIHFGPRLRPKTESEEPKILWGKFLKYGLVLSAAFAVAIIAEIISAGRGSLPSGFGLAVSAAGVIFGGLYLGFFFVCMWWAYPLVGKLLSSYPAAGFKRSFFFKKFKTGPAWGTFWAAFFTIPYFVIIAIVRAPEDASVFLPYIVLFAVTAIGGILWDILRIREIKKWIDRDKVVSPSFYSDQMFPVFLKSYLIGAAFVTVPVFVADTMFGATDEIWGASLLGFFLGASAHRLIWAHLYEKRNDVQLVHEVDDFQQPVESVA